MTNNSKALILGASGMLGGMILDVLAAEPRINVAGTVRDEETLEYFRAMLPTASWHLLNAETADSESLIPRFRTYQWIINCIGLTKPYIQENDTVKVTQAIRINSLFSHQVGNAALKTGSQVLQIATDCVYDGVKGAYAETDAHNALDVYGKTKSLGEVNLPNVHHLRCSIVGPEPRKDLFLLAWLLNQPQGAELKGFTNHRWNGVTTLHFAHICRGIILHRLELPYLQHIIPADFITKYRLLCAFAQTYGRDDLVIKAVETGTVIDRTLATGNEEMNRTLWKCAGYEQPPGIEAMVKEMAAYDFCFRVKNR